MIFGRFFLLGKSPVTFGLTHDRQDISIPPERNLLSDQPTAALSIPAISEDQLGLVPEIFWSRDL